MHRRVGPIHAIETIAWGRGIRNLKRLNRRNGRGQWRKMKGIAWIELEDGARALVELHWYQAHGIGQREFKVKRLIEELP